ncbi:ABC transporter substrate-binding protein [Streptosporangium sp. NPDC049248]|uniref:ABC transporter substrate-binding protein n=1 Tax=Streptosporangium sp. NPDC049248 TaxID=3155651 RepID=UPI003419EE6D
MALPLGIHYLIGKFDTFAGHRPDNRRLPVILLRREIEADPADDAAVRAIVDYQERLCETRDGARRALVPYALIDDTRLRDAEPHIDLLDDLVHQLARNLPRGNGGELKLPRFHTCRAVLRTSAGDGTIGAKRGQLRDGLYLELIRRRKWLATLAQLAGTLGQEGLVGLVRTVFSFFVFGLPAWIYGLWLRGSRGLRWVGPQIPGAGGDFLTAALDLSAEGRYRQDPVLTQRILVMALLRDLERASRPSRLWIYRLRRQWSFVVLLREVGAPGTPGRQFLDTYAHVVRAQDSAPLMILGALTGPVPSYAVPVGSDPQHPSAVADLVGDLYRSEPQGPVTEGVYVVTLSPEDDDGAAANALAPPSRVMVRPNSFADYVRPALLPLVLVLVAGTTLYYLRPWQQNSCERVETGEIVGVTDGQECSLAAPGRDEELRALEKIVDEQNRRLDPDLPYRSVVFFAPLSARAGNLPPNGLQTLRGVIAAQNWLNTQKKQAGLQSRMQLKLLIANPGERFAYGALRPDSPDDPNVAAKIIGRAAEDRIVGVVGITQSREESLAAVRELGAEDIPVIASSVTGSNMVEDHKSRNYFQVSPPNSRIAQIMVEFSRHSDQIRVPSHTSQNADGYRKAVVVYDPADESFSVDLMEKFTEQYGPGAVEHVAYDENDPKQQPGDVAARICRAAEKPQGLVVYTGRSALIPNLFAALQRSSECETGGIVPPLNILSETMPKDFIEEPHILKKNYPFVRLFYTGFLDLETTPLPFSSQKFIENFGNVFNKLKITPDSDAAGGYDALNVMSEAVDAVYLGSPKTVESHEVQARLNDPGIEGHLGATGTLNLDSGNKYPPNRPIYVLEPLPDGTQQQRLACGLLPNGKNQKIWFTANEEFDCP